MNVKLIAPVAYCYNSYNAICIKRNNVDVAYLRTFLVEDNLYIKYCSELLKTT